MNSRKFLGYTLPELLIVLSIIAILVAIALPVFQYTRRKGYQTTCNSNIRQSITSVRMYVEDFDGSWPSSEVWDDWWWTMRKDMVICPLYHYDPKVPPKGIPGYALNIGLMNDKDSVTRIRQDSSIPYPSTTVALFEAANSIGYSSCYDPFIEITPYPYEQEEVWKRHLGGSNYAFCDGHVKFYLPGQVGCSERINDGTLPTFRLHPTLGKL